MPAAAVEVAAATVEVPDETILVAVIAMEVELDMLKAGKGFGYDSASRSWSEIFLCSGAGEE